MARARRSSASRRRDSSAANSCSCVETVRFLVKVSPHGLHGKRWREQGSAIELLLDGLGQVANGAARVKAEEGIQIFGKVTSYDTKRW